MDAEDADPPSEINEPQPRPPVEDDLAKVCGRLNELGARYVVVGGFAIILAGYPRTTGDVDLLIATDLANEALVYRALEILPLAIDGEVERAMHKLHTKPKPPKDPPVKESA